VSGRGEIARIVLRYACARFRRVVLLAVHPHGADGWAGAGEGITRETVARLHVPLAEPGVVRTVVSTRAHFLGPLTRTEANIGLLRALAGGAPRTAFAMPILARGRVANVLYADGGRGGLVDPGCVGELLILASRISQSYGSLIARRRG
jgi:prepilin-type processing-associated H-X9-DG protein